MVLRVNHFKHCKQSIKFECNRKSLKMQNHRFKLRFLILSGVASERRSASCATGCRCLHVNIPADFIKPILVHHIRASKNITVVNFDNAFSATACISTNY